MFNNINPELIDQFEKRIKWFRKEKMNLSQLQFASILGVTENTVKNYENGRTVPSVNEINKMCELDNSLDLNWLIKGKFDINKNRINNEFEEMENKWIDKMVSLYEFKILSLEKEIKKLKNSE